MAKVFVTGANGFIGPHLIEFLLERGDDVVGLVRPTSDLRPLTPLFDRYAQRLRLVVGDLRQPESLGAGLENVEFVYHLGAVLMGTSEAEFRATNVEGTRHLLDAVQRQRTERFQRFLYTSSQAGAGPSPTPAPVDETAAPRPVSWYGESKRDAEEIVHQYGAQGLPITIVRPVGVYGAREQLLAESSFPLVRMGFSPRIGLIEKIVSLVYVADLVRGMVAGAEGANTVGKTYFLGNPQSYRAGEVVTAIADAMDKRVRIPVITPLFALALAANVAEWAHYFSGNRPLATRDKIRETRQRYWACSPQLAQQDFGWVATVSLQEGIARTVRDWEQRRAAMRLQELDEPLRVRVVKSFALSFLISVIEAALDLMAGGVSFEGLARVLGLESAPGWLTFAAIVPVFTMTMGLIALWTARARAIWQFLAGAAVGVGLELANQLWLHFWAWNPNTFGRIPGPWLIALVLGTIAGLYPVLINVLVRSFARVHLRLGR